MVTNNETSLVIRTASVGARRTNRKKETNKKLERRQDSEREKGTKAENKINKSMDVKELIFYSGARKKNIDE